MPTYLTFPNRKIIRARVIADYVRAAGYPGVVLATCGNAAQALRDAGLVVVELGAKGILNPNQWLDPADIHRLFPTLFDATSGHLPIHLMIDLAVSFRAELGDLPGRYYDVPTGSGETIVCLRWAYPTIRFIPYYDDTPATRYEPMAPLNDLVDGLMAPYISPISSNA